MRIGIDIDEVLADFNGPFIELVGRLTGKHLPRPGANYPDKWHYYLDPALGDQLPTSAELDYVWKFIKTSTFWNRLPPLEHTRETLARLNHLRVTGHEIYFITSRPGNDAKLWSELWLTDLGMVNPTVLIAPSDWAKGQLAAALSLDVFIDDKPNNCADVNVATQQHTMPTGSPVKCKIFLVNQPANRDDRIEPELQMYLRGVERVDSALQALERVLGNDGEQLRRAA